MQWSDEHRIETPEQIDIDLEIAGLGSRFMAQCADWLIKWSIVIIVGFLGAVILSLLGGATKKLDEAGPVGIGLMLAGLVAFFYSYDIYHEVRNNGQTPGKRFAEIRVIKDNGAPVDGTAAAIRNLLGLADFLPVGYVLGAFLILLNKRGQRLGDMAAGTLVVRERKAAPLLEEERTLEVFTPEEPYVFTREQLAACTPTDLEALKQFFRRYRSMDRSARSKLAQQIAETLVDRMNYTTTQEAIVAEEFLAALCRELEQSTPWN